mgnify:CR=1 FL=1
MKKSYFCIPSSNIWNNEAFVNSVRNSFSTKQEALERAEMLSRQYNEDFFVCCTVTKVSTPVNLVDLTDKYPSNEKK